jgi:lipid A ethanolaminephosphotransferase
MTQAPAATDAHEPAQDAAAPGRGVRSTWAALAVVLFLASVGNLRLWQAVATGPQAVSWPVIAAAFLVLVALYDLVLQAVALPWLLKPLGAALLIVSAVTSQVMLDHGVLIDASMIRNVFETDSREAGELVTTRAVLFVLAVGVAPALLLLFTRIRYGPLRKELALRGLVVGATLLLGAGAAWLAYGDVSMAVRANKQLRFMVNPVSPIFALCRYGTERDPGPAEALLPVATDARRQPGATRQIVVLVVGESATASHFSLNGYERDTNPELRARDVLNFPHVTSCGTSTAESLPCMFSNLGQADYTHDRAEARENLLDVLQRTGVTVLWRDNNSGGKGVPDRVPHGTVDGPRPGPDDDPWDGALVTDLQAILDTHSGDLLVVLHQKGSHGPAYWARTPPEWKRFLPECSRDDLHNCPRDEIVNAYDNTILYTDHVLAQLIDLLAANSGSAQVALLYVSDHGESLGENGIWLHGFPRWLAPEEQTHVPMIFWASHEFCTARGLSADQLQAASQRELSHDNLFHTVLGLFGVQTSAYDAALDVFARARAP